jgi:alkaline phosphatase
MVLFILLIFKLPDGHGPSSVTMAREVSGKEVLEIEKFLVGTARTSSANSWVTDSAAGISSIYSSLLAATAYASCVKTINNVVGLDRNLKPVVTVLEAAKKKGLKTGMVVTSRITHGLIISFSFKSFSCCIFFSCSSQRCLFHTN